MNESRTSQVLKCFSLTESATLPEDSELRIQDFQVQPAEQLPDSSIASSVVDSIVKFIISSGDRMYTLFDSSFDEKSKNLFIIFFPNVEEAVQDITEHALSLDNVSSVQWSRVLPADAQTEEVEDIEYFVVLKIDLNIVSTVDLKTIQQASPTKSGVSLSDIVKSLPATSPVDVLSSVKKFVEVQ